MRNTKIRNGNITIGSWITIGHPAVIKILYNFGFAWLTIDMEHNSMIQL